MVGRLLASLVVIAGIVVLPFLGEPGLADPRTADIWGLWINFLGTLHPLFLHLPIGVFVLVMLLETIGLLARGRYEPPTLIPLGFALVNGILALVFGYCLYLTGSYSGEMVEQHKISALVFCALLVPCLLLKLAHRRSPGRFNRVHLGYLASLLACGGAMTIAGHLGGEITHGDPVEKLPFKVLAKRAAAAEALRNDPVVYEHIIQPILEDRCVYCHGPKKQEGTYRMDSYQALLTPGDDATGLLPGDPAASAMLTRLELPHHDEQHMPPTDKPQPTAGEIALIRWWISQGAPEHKRQGELTLTPEAEEALAGLVSPEEVKAREAARKQEEAEAHSRFLAGRERIRSAWREFEHSHPGALSFVSAGSLDMRFTAVSDQDIAVDPGLDGLKLFAEHLVAVNLAFATLDDGAAAVIAQFASLRSLNLSETSITDTFFANFSELADLELLNLHGTKVTPGLAAQLDKFPGLKRLYVGGTGIGAEQAIALRETLSENRETPVEVIGDDGLPTLESLPVANAFQETVRSQEATYGTLISALAKTTLSSKDPNHHQDEEFKKFTAKDDHGVDFVFHSLPERQPWVQLTFDSPYLISAFELKNRATLPERAEGIELQRQLPDGSWKAVWQSKGPEVSWQVDLSKDPAPTREATAFRFVVNKEEETYLHLSQVWLWGRKSDRQQTAPGRAAVAVAHNSSSWSPGTVSGLGLWLDGADLTSLTATAGNVSQWNDKSPNQYHAYALSPAVQPQIGTLHVNGKHALEFQTARLVSKTPKRGNWQDLYIVADWNGAERFGNYNGLFTGFGEGIGIVGNSQDAGTSLWLQGRWWTSLYVNGTASDGANVLGTLAKPFLLSCSADRAIEVPGYSIGNDRNHVQPSNRRPWDGAICEIVAFARKLTESERHQLEGYLAHKWGLTAGLPTDHPFKEKAP